MQWLAGTLPCVMSGETLDLQLLNISKAMCESRDMTLLSDVNELSQEAVSLFTVGTGWLGLLG